ncbi:MAG: hypothetical protein ACREA5_03665 [Nitrosotalea sp.]
MSECYLVPKVHVTGNLITTYDGTVNLSSQSGIVTIGDSKGYAV